MNNLVQTQNNINTAPVTIEDNNAAISTVNVDQALAEWNAYQEITEKMLDETDYQVIKEKKYKKKSAWRKYARAFNINTEIIKEDIVKTEKSGAVKEATFVVRATLPNGRYADGWGNCSRGERGFAHPNHDIPATAMTRAQNRAIADLIGAGEVTADEIQAENTFQPAGNVKAKLAKKPAQKVEEATIVEAEVVKEQPKVFDTNKTEKAEPAKMDNAREIAESIVAELPKRTLGQAYEKLISLNRNGIVSDEECPAIKEEIERLFA